MRKRKRVCSAEQLRDDLQKVKHLVGECLACDAARYISLSLRQGFCRCATVPPATHNGATNEVCDGGDARKSLNQRETRICAGSSVILWQCMLFLAARHIIALNAASRRSQIFTSSLWQISVVLRTPRPFRDLCNVCGAAGPLHTGYPDSTQRCLLQVQKRNTPNMRSPTIYGVRSLFCRDVVRSKAGFQFCCLDRPFNYPIYDHLRRPASAI